MFDAYLSFVLTFGLDLHFISKTGKRLYFLFGWWWSNNTILCWIVL